MLFRFFVISGSTERDIERAGFSVHTYSEENVYCGSTVEQSISSQKGYGLNGEIWESIDASCLGDRAYCLARTPFLPFEELWDVLMESKSRDDRLGAAILMFNKHYALLHEKYKALRACASPDKTTKTALAILAPLFQN